VIAEINEEALGYAYQRVADWIAVQAGQPQKDQALKRMFESLGLDPESSEEFLDWQRKTIPEAEEGSVLLGLLVGLLIRQHDHDTYGF
jgi:hypothetical protein